jgi:predicted RNA-binding Zn-ribbon protein involved in translation (DUF1610 family)
MSEKALHQFAVEVDTEIVRIYGELWKLHNFADICFERVRYAVPTRIERGDGWRSPIEYFIVTKDDKDTPYDVKTVRTFLDEGKFDARWGEDAKIKDALEKYDDLVLQCKAKYAELKEWTDKYTGWSRFYLVSGGHIHSSMDCSTCNNGKSATNFIWLPQLSGLTEKEAVESEGAILCTVCFPSAPVEWTNAYDLAHLVKLAKRCEGGGRFVPYGEHTCPVCGEWVSILRSQRLRAHNKPEK